MSDSVSVQYKNYAGFLWRLARAYGNMFELTTDVEEKKNYAFEGRLCYRLLD